jgi:rRNA small subunit pseudouridine methyltransferase Nep1
VHLSDLNMPKNKRKRSESESTSSSSSGSDSDDERHVKADSSGLVGDTVPFTVILDLANLETVKTKKGEYQLLNCDDHIQLLKKTNRDPAKHRPDIIHQEMMAVLDSPLNKAGKVRLLVHTEKNVLIEVNSSTRVPRTFKRFSGLMVQLLHKLKIRSADGNDTLLKVIKNPIGRHLPAGALCYGFSQHGKLFSPTSFAETLPDDKPIVFVLGAMAAGSIKPEDHPYMTSTVSLSEYPLSGVVAINRLLGSVEARRGIL